MARARPTEPWTVDEFLAWEREQEERYEYVDGVIRMMVGGTLDHNTIVGNVFSSLRPRLRGGPCRVFFESVKVAQEAIRVSIYERDDSGWRYRTLQDPTEARPSPLPT